MRFDDTTPISGQPFLRALIVCLRDALARNGNEIHIVSSIRKQKRTTMDGSPRQQTSTSPDGSECTQLLQLLAKNPSAALKVFTFNSPNDEKPPVQTYKGRRPKFTPRINTESIFLPPPQVQYSTMRIYCLPHKFNTSQTILETSQKPRKSNHDVLLSKEDIELKSKCVDDLGNFDFEAILPATYSKCDIYGQHRDMTGREGGDFFIN